MAGQGTVALELIEDAGPLDVLLVCLGGGGLLSGCATATAALSPDTRIIGVEPEAGDDFVRSLAAGERVADRGPADDRRRPADQHPGRADVPGHPGARRRGRHRLRRGDRHRDEAAVRAREGRRRAERRLRVRRAAGRQGGGEGPARRRDDLGRERHRGAVRRARGRRRRARGALAARAGGCADRCARSSSPRPCSTPAGTRWSRARRTRTRRRRWRCSPAWSCSPSRPR